MDAHRSAHAPCRDDGARSLQLDFGPGVVEYLSRAEASVTLRSSPRHGCCGGTVAVPVAEAGAPLDAGRYQTFERDGVRVYVQRELLTGEHEALTIGLEGFGPWRRLWVGGLDARM